MRPLIPVTRTRDFAIALTNGRVGEIRDDVHALAVPGIRHAAIGEIREGHARVGVGPAIRRADAAVPEDAGRRQRAQPATPVRRAPRARPEPPGPWHPPIAVRAGLPG